MTIDIDAIRRREQAATPGPWGVGNGHHIVRDLEVTGVGSFSCTSPVAEVASEMDREAWRTDSSNGTDPRADAEFIAHARTDIPALLAELAAARAERDEYAHDNRRVVAQLTAANHHTDGLAADVRDMQKANTAYANEVAELRREQARTQETQP